MTQIDLTVFVPKGIITDIKFSISLYPPSWTTPSNKKDIILDNFIFILSKISFMLSRKKYETYELVPIFSTILKNEIGNNYRKYIDYLITHKFLVTDGYYIVGKSNKPGKCYYFGFSDKYNTRKSDKYIINRRALIKKMGIWKKIMEDSIAKDPLMLNLYDSLKKIDVDYPIIQKMIEEKVKNKEISQKKADIELNKAYKVFKNDMFLKKDVYGRVHTNVTNISKTIRSSFTLDKEPIGHIDIRSSQPALLLPILYQNLNQIVKNSQFLKISKLKSGMLGMNRYESVTFADFGFHNISSFRRGFKDELLKYETWLKNDIYDNFKDCWNILFKDDLSRKDIKRYWFGFAFGKKTTNPSKMTQIWENEFPLITKLLNYIKQDDYTLLAKMLQKIESKVILQEICGELFSLKIDAVTIHDSVCVKRSMVKTVIPIFNKILKKYNIISGISVE